MNLRPNQEPIRLTRQAPTEPAAPPPGPSGVSPAPAIRHEVVVRVEHHRCEVVDELLTARAELDDARREVISLGQEIQELKRQVDEEVARAHAFVDDELERFGLLEGAEGEHSGHRLVSVLSRLVRERDEARAEVVRQGRELETLRAALNAFAPVRLCLSCGIGESEVSPQCAEHPTKAPGELDRLRARVAELESDPLAGLS
jgi:chromosome segregation ATPase